MTDGRIPVDPEEIIVKVVVACGILIALALTAMFIAGAVGVWQSVLS